MKCEILARKTNEDTEEKRRYEVQSEPIQQSILQLEEASDKMQHSVDELKPFEVNVTIDILLFMQIELVHR
jgi:hypothetical protein